MENTDILDYMRQYLNVFKAWFGKNHSECRFWNQLNLIEICKNKNYGHTENYSTKRFSAIFNIIFDVRYYKMYIGYIQFIS